MLFYIIVFNLIASKGCSTGGLVAPAFTNGTLGTYRSLSINRIGPATILLRENIIYLTLSNLKKYSDDKADRQDFLGFSA